MDPFQTMQEPDFNTGVSDIFYNDNMQMDRD